MDARDTVVAFPVLEPIGIDSESLPAFRHLIPAELQAKLEDNLFAIGLTADGTPCGALVFSQDDELFLTRLDSLYIAPEFRRRHIGTALFREFLIFIRSYEEFATYALAAEFADDGSGLREFLQSMGFEMEATGEKSLAATAASLSGCPLMQKEAALPAGISCTSLSGLPGYLLKVLNTELERVGVNYLGAPVSEETVLPECSFAAFEGETPVCCVCFSQGGSDRELYLSLFYTRPDSTQLPLAVLGCAGEAVLKAYPPDTLVKIPVLEPSSERLAAKLLGEAGQVCDPIYEAVLDFDRLEEEEA